MAGRDEGGPRQAAPTNHHFTRAESTATLRRRRANALVALEAALEALSVGDVDEAAGIVAAAIGWLSPGRAA